MVQNDYEYDVSLHCSATRTEMWQEAYKSYMQNKVSVEAVFVGNKYPSFKMPSNFTFIYSEVKPAQCWEIAARNCRGKYLAQSSDDYFYPKGYFDDMVNFYKKQVEKYSTDNIITGGTHHTGFSKIPARQCRLWTKNAQPNCVLPMDFFITSKLYRELGGLDKKYISLCHHWDVMMRVMEIGGKCIMAKIPFWERHHEYLFKGKKDTHNYLSSVTGRIDKAFFGESWWCPWNKEKYKSKLGVKKYKNKQELKESGDPYYIANGRGYLPISRQTKFESFDDENILTVSQGPVYGKWDVKSEVL